MHFECSFSGCVLVVLMIEKINDFSWNLKLYLNNKSNKSKMKLYVRVFFFLDIHIMINVYIISELLILA